MKQFKLATLAAAGLLATGLAGAGTLQVTPIQYAAETIVSGTTLTAPVFSYALAAPISVSSSPQFDFDFTLTDAVWNHLAATQTAGAAGAHFYIISQDGVTSLKATSVSYSNGNATLRLRFDMVAGGAAGTVGAAPGVNYTFPQGSNIVIGTTATPPQVLGTAAMVAPANSCTPADVNIPLRVNMFNSLGQETSETAAGSSINFVQQNTYLRSSSGIAVNATAPASTIESSRIDVTSPSLGRFFTNAADAGGTAADTNVVAIARVQFTNRGTFKDAAVGATGNYTVAAGFTAAGGAAGANGNVSVDKLNLRITGNFNTAGFVYLSSLATCLDSVTITDGALVALATGVAPAATERAALTATSATFTGLKITANNFPTATPTAYVCYKRDVTATSSILPASQFALDPSVSNVTHTAESGSPVCGASVYNLRQNGVQIDLRNVVNVATAGGWTSFVRLINTDESQTATVTGQVIRQDGTVLAGAVIAASIPPRGYVVMTSAQIETALAGTASAGYVPTGAGTNYRLRLTSPTSSLRAQNYLFNPASQNYIEASSSQGDEQPGRAETANSVTEDQRK